MPPHHHLEQPSFLNGVSPSMALLLQMQMQLLSTRLMMDLITIEVSLVLIRDAGLREATESHM
jgi:hypothetical protein